MLISFSSIRQFRRCPRQWCFKSLFANSHAKKDHQRRKVFLLAQLESIAGWRGNLVDQVITKKLVPVLAQRGDINPGFLLGSARQLFDRQLAFARRGGMWEEGMVKSKLNEDFAALMPIEYDGRVDETELDQAWLDIEQALTNLLEMGDLLARVKQARKLMAQRALTVDHLNLKYRAVPDLVCFFEKDPPLIIDWKVHTKGYHDYRLQLFSYALALHRCPPHSDFPASLSGVSPTEIQLLEVQLLTRQQRYHELTEEDVAEVDDHLARAGVEMKMMSDDPGGDANPFDFPVTTDPENCQLCPFRTVCLEEPACPTYTQTTFL